MEVLPITDGDIDKNGAFCPDKMAEQGVDNLLLSQALAKALGPLAGLLKDGAGFGVYADGDEASIIGFTAPK